jgi:peroxiredoxin
MSPHNAWVGNGKLTVRKSVAFLSAIALLALAPSLLHAGETNVRWTEQEKPIVKEIQSLRSLPDDVRAATTRRLALEIRRLPAGPHKLKLANALASRSTEGDFGHDTLQEVASTLARALKEAPPGAAAAEPFSPYLELAQLVRYEHVRVESNSRQLAAALDKLEADDAHRDHADFTLTDLEGKPWTLRALRGKVVMVNFWATWCPPCRKEIPDLEALYQRFRSQGLVILGISDEDAAKVRPFGERFGMTYPILLDPGDNVNKLFAVEGIPKTFVYGRDGHLVTESIDMRTRRQFLAMLAQAGLR